MRKIEAGIRVLPKNAPGEIKLERRTHKGAVLISGGLTVLTKNTALNTIIVNRLRDAANQIRNCGGIVGHIKTSTAVSTIEVISVTDEKAMIKKLPEHRMRISLAATVFKIEPEKAERIISYALKDIKKSARHSEK